MDAQLLQACSSDDPRRAWPPCFMVCALAGMVHEGDGGVVATPQAAQISEQGSDPHRRI
jgi:hypothetical protein